MGSSRGPGHTRAARPGSRASGAPRSSAPVRSDTGSDRPATSRCATRISSRTRPGSWRPICAFADIPFEPAMLEYSKAVDVSEKPHHQRLLQPPTRGVRDWRSQMGAEDVRAFEAIAGRPPRRSRIRAARVGLRRTGNPCSCLGRLVPGQDRCLEHGLAGGAALAALASPPPAAVLRRRSYGPSPAAVRDEATVEREEVRALGRDAGRVPAHREPPDDPSVRPAHRVRLLLERGEEDVGFR